MTRPALRRSATVPLLALLAALAPVPAASARRAPPPVPGGEISTLLHGRYQCELPGIAGGPVGHAQNEYEFVVTNGSNYRSGGMRGSYLLTGNQVVMTTGRLKGLKLRRISGTFLRRIEAHGGEGQLRCVLVNRSTA